MRLYRRGDQGEPVRDIQGRLSALGHETDPDDAGDFGDGTRAAVVAFQESRGLDADGIEVEPAVRPDGCSMMASVQRQHGKQNVL